MRSMISAAVLAAMTLGGMGVAHAQFPAQPVRAAYTVEPFAPDAERADASGDVQSDARAVGGPGEAVPGETVPDEAVPGEAASDVAVPGEAASADVVPGEAVPDEAEPREP